MERALGILGASVLAALIALLLALPQGSDQATSPEPEGPRGDWEDLNDSEKLERLDQNETPSQQAILNRAVAYDDPSRCDDLDSALLREKCHAEASTNESEDTVSERQAEDERLLNQAVAYDDPTRCESIQNASLRQRCNSLT